MRTHELWKFGTKLKLVGQPFEILAVLISRPGELVTRDELRDRLWPAETFVDFNHGLNAAVNKLREALSDSADDPKYIETLPRRGYRFIGKLETLEAPIPESVSTVPPVAEPISAVTPAASEPETVSAAPPKSRRRLRFLQFLGASTLFVILIFIGSAMLYLHFQRGERSERTVRYTPSAPPAAPTHGWQKIVIAGRARYEGPQFSPDGKRIVFMSNRTGGMDLWICDVDGSNLKQVTTLGDAGTPRWSPDGKSIAFDSRVHNYGGQPDNSKDGEGFGAVLVVEVASGAQRFLAVGPADNVVPSWSHDGKYLYFASNRDGTYQVWKTPVAGGDPVQITHGGGFAAWESSDGKYVYYAKTNQPNPEIWRASVNGGEEMIVSPAVRPGTWASWSVTSDGIYFVGSTLNNVPTLTFYEFSTQRLREFTSLDTFPFWFATSNTGKRAVFSREVADNGSIVTLENYW